jgi:hypothetical protein
LNVKAFGLDRGLIWGLGLFFLPQWVVLFEGPTHALVGIGHLYRGFDISPLGSVIGMAYGLADGGVGGLVFAWLYNSLNSRIK